MVINTHEILSALDKLSIDDFSGDISGRIQILEASRKLIRRLQKPTETVAEITFQTPFIISGIEIFQDLGIWEAWTTNGGQKSLQELAGLANADVDINLLRRLCRLLVSVYIFDETSPDVYKPTPMSLHMGSKETMGPQSIRAIKDHWEVASRAFPSFLKDTSYREPLDPTSTAYAAGNPDKLPVWDRCAKYPEIQASFSGAMASWTRQKVPWPEFFDTNTLLSGSNSDLPILVDMGGNVGNDLQTFLSYHKELPAGSLVLQDRPEALAHAKVSDKIVVMPHDFFTPQPVVGARAYFFHAVFHDWADEKAIEILKQLAPAMKKGYSKLLITDVVLPLLGSTVIQTSMDVCMMSSVASLERTEEAWTNMLTTAGFKVIKFWKDPVGYETLIEAELS